MNKQGILLIISGPSGSGKGTIVERLCEKNNFSLSISATTRKPREYEKDGVHYFFHTREEFEKMRDRKELLEWAEFCGNYYGTPRKYVTEQLMAGNNVILEIEVQGALQVKKIYPEGVLIFMVPPNLEELGNRLTKRGTEDKETINKRLRRALEEMELVEEYDYLVINDTIEQATEDMLTIVAAEKMKCSRNKNIKKIFKGEMKYVKTFLFRYSGGYHTGFRGYYHCQQIYHRDCGGKKSKTAGRPSASYD